jgi:hypothetical protein
MVTNEAKRFLNQRAGFVLAKAVNKEDFGGEGVCHLIHHFCQNILARSLFNEALEAQIMSTMDLQYITTHRGADQRSEFKFLPK